MRRALTPVKKKICMMGDSAVGKTSLVQRYVFNRFDNAYRSTVGVDIYNHTDAAMAADGSEQPLTMILWDMQGDVPDDTLFRRYLHGAAGAVVVGDVTRLETIETMDRYARLFLAERPGRGLGFALNKIDLAPEQERHAAIQSLTANFAAPVMTTSAKTGGTVIELFRRLGQQILKTGV